MTTSISTRMNRKPPSEVLRELRREAGFGCPVPGCSSPYLYWHHFDPPWHERQHHDPAGMIALCAEHHGKADAGAFTREQLHALKASAQSDTVAGRFDWLRRELIIRAGSNFYFGTPYILTYRTTPLIWFTRDPQDHILVNLRMLTRSAEPRLVMEESYWTLGGRPENVVCPPWGKLVDVKYSNGDRVRVEFRETQDEAEGRRVFPHFWPHESVTAYPATTCEISYRVGGTNIDIGPSHFKAGSSKWRHSTFTDCGPISIGPNPNAAITIPEVSVIVAAQPSRPRRNDLCSCGSNKKYKKCCALNETT